MTKNRYNIIIDTREKVGAWDLSNCSFASGITAHRKIKTGDYAIEGYEDKLCLERKRNVGEVAGNITEKRFKDCLLRMKAFEHAYILLEFEVSDVLRFPIGSGIPKSKWPRLRITPEYILKCLMQMSMAYNVKVLFCGNKSNAEKVAASIIRRFLEQEDKDAKK